jgi:hypothetical protein
VRTSRGVLPSFSYSRVLGFLTAAPWEQIATTGGYGGTGYGGTGYGGAAPAGPRIRFVTTIKRGAKSADRLVPVRRIVRRAGVTMIELDGAVFTLDRCTIDAYRASECLTLRTDLTFDDPEPEQETQQHFARPPGAS